ncbi:MAG: hypothetical protein ACRD51_02700 [Candidatus Acidiferrum sp.]
MGNELTCTVRFGKEVSEGKVLLETSEILFRGDFRLKIPFASVQSAKAVDEELRLQTANGLAIFELGPAAEKWREKILHPKTRIEKIGLKPGARVSLLGSFDADFLKELKLLAASVTVNKTAAETCAIFFAASSKKELLQVAKAAKSIKGAAALWIVYPKGQKSVTENDVIAAGRKTGLKDVKVIGFSSTHTALKFVLPLTSAKGSMGCMQDTCAEFRVWSSKIRH